MMAWDGHDSRPNIPILRRCVTEDLKANWQVPKHSSYLRQTEQARKLDTIGLYRYVWIAAIASSRTRLPTLTGTMYKTSQCELRSLRVNSGMLNVIRIVTYYTLPPLESPTSSWIAMAFWR